MPAPGAPVVLTADRTLMAHYRLLLDGMMAASQTTAMPAAVVKTVLLPRAPHPGGQALVAPLGLRRVEASLRAAGLGEQLSVVDDAHLEQALGPATRLIAVSSGEPLGLGMSSSTMTGVVGGSIYPLAMFRDLLARVERLRQERCPEAKVLLGGPGAWQLSDQPADTPTRIDHVVCGYAEGNVAAVVGDLLAGRELPYQIPGEAVDAAQIPPIAGASTMGVVEISRGCGLGCGFCTLGAVPMQHLPLDTILADVQTNLRAGQTSIAVLSEDLLRYGGSGLHCRPAELLALLESLRRLPGLRLLQADHVNLASVAQYCDEELGAVRRLLAGGRQRYPWFNLGVETPAGRLLEANGGRPKMAGHYGDDWGEFCLQQLLRLGDAGFVPMASLVLGLPGETADDVAATLKWVRRLAGQPVSIFPVLYAPLDGRQPPGPEDLTAAHWQLVRECYESNFRWVPRYYWDGQVGAGVGLGRRLVIQALGQGNVVLWRSVLKAKQRAARR